MNSCENCKFLKIIGERTIRSGWFLELETRVIDYGCERELKQDGVPGRKFDSRVIDYGRELELKQDGVPGWKFDSEENKPSNYVCDFYENKMYFCGADGNFRRIK